MSVLAVKASPAISIIEPTGATLQAFGGASDDRRGASIAADDLAELVRSFTDVTERLQTTHQSLQAQVGQLQAELAEANEQLQRSRELAALGEMAAGIAHEIRNPLGSIALDVEGLREDAVGRPAQEQICNRVLRAVERLDCIVGDVLRFGRDLRIQPCSCDPMDVIEMALLASEAVIRRGSIKIERVGSTEGHVTLDRHLIAQSIANLVRNAAEAMIETNSPERVIRIGARRIRKAQADGRRSEHVVFRVEDTGPGVPETLVERIFNPFFTTRSEGTGLGLAIVHRIIDAHHGAITVRNVTAAPGALGGARFDIAIPSQQGRTFGSDSDSQSSRRRRAGRTDAASGSSGGTHGGLDEAVRRRIGPLAR